nr:MAG TPA: hypothetical protein [Caudoviricetes sp.]
MLIPEFLLTQSSEFLPLCFPPSYSEHIAHYLYHAL